MRSVDSIGFASTSSAAAIDRASAPVHEDRTTGQFNGHTVSVATGSAEGSRGKRSSVRRALGKLTRALGSCATLGKREAAAGGAKAAHEPHRHPQSTQAGRSESGDKKSLSVLLAESAEYHRLADEGTPYSSFAAGAAHGSDHSDETDSGRFDLDLQTGQAVQHGRLEPASSASAERADSDRFELDLQTGTVASHGLETASPRTSVSSDGEGASVRQRDRQADQAEHTHTWDSTRLPSKSSLRTPGQSGDRPKQTVKWREDVRDVEWVPADRKGGPRTRTSDPDLLAIKSEMGRSMRLADEGALKDWYPMGHPEEFVAASEIEEEGGAGAHPERRVAMDQDAMLRQAGLLDDAGPSTPTAPTAPASAAPTLTRSQRVRETNGNAADRLGLAAAPTRNDAGGRRHQNPFQAGSAALMSGISRLGQLMRR